MQQRECKKLRTNRVWGKGKVECTLVQALRFCTRRMAHRGVQVLLYSFLNTALEGGEGSASRSGRYLPRERPVQEVGWAPRPVWTGAENLAPTGIRSPERPTCSQSLYRLIYRAHVCRDATLQMSHTA